MTAADASFLSSARTWAIESPALKTTLNTAGLEGAANGARSAIACAESTSALGAGSVGGNVVSRQPVPCAARREDQTATRMTAVRTASGRMTVFYTEERNSCGELHPRRLPVGPEHCPNRCTVDEGGME